MKKAGILLLFLIFLAASAGASSMVTFFIIETGLPENDGKPHGHSILWENAFMDVFFDAGFIVSNAPIHRLENKNSGDILKSASIDLKGAGEWGIDFIIITVLDYPNELQNPGEISFFIYTVTTQKKVYEKKINRNSNKSAKDEFDELKIIVRGLVPFIN